MGQYLSPDRTSGAGKHHQLKATDFLGQQVSVEVYAHLTPTHIEKQAPCSVFMSARVPGLSISMPDMTAAEARELAHALLMAARDADRLDGIALPAVEVESA